MFFQTLVDYDAPEETQETKRTWWSLLKVDGPMLELFIEVNAIFRGGRLHVSSHLQADVDGKRKVGSVIFYGQRWIKFSEG